MSTRGCVFFTRSRTSSHSGFSQPRANSWPDRSAWSKPRHFRRAGWSDTGTTAATSSKGSLCGRAYSLRNRRTAISPRAHTGHAAASNLYSITARRRGPVCRPADRAPVSAARRCSRQSPHSGIPVQWVDAACRSVGTAAHRRKLSSAWQASQKQTEKAPHPAHRGGATRSSNSWATRPKRDCRRFFTPVDSATDSTALASHSWAGAGLGNISAARRPPVWFAS